MPRILTKCPQTARTVPTVLRMREAAFESLSGSHAFRCPACNDIHHWEKGDAWLEGSPAIAAAPAAVAAVAA
jgi:hypothetical protein